MQVFVCQLSGHGALNLNYEKPKRGKVSFWLLNATGHCCTYAIVVQVIDISVIG